jgi:hypothetical protein
MGGHAQELLVSGGIKVLAGAPDLTPRELAQKAAQGKLEGEVEGCCGGCDDDQEQGKSHDCGCGH